MIPTFTFAFESRLTRFRPLTLRKWGPRILPDVPSFRRAHDPYSTRIGNQGINLKGCLYFIGKGNSKFSLSKWRITSKIALHWWFGCFFEDMSVCIKQLAWHKVLLGTGYFFFPSILKGLQKITPSFLKGCKIFWRECEGLDPKIRVIALQFYSMLATSLGVSLYQRPSYQKTKQIDLKARSGLVHSFAR